MADKIADLFVEVTAKTDKLQRDLNNLKTKTASTTKSMDKSFSSLKGTFASLKSAVGGLGLAIGFTALLGVVKKSITAARDQVKAQGKVRQALLNSANAAGFTAKELFKVAEALEQTTGVDTIDILNDITNVLLTFNKVQGDVFKRAQEAAIDLSTALGTDLRGSTIQLAKALQDPVVGLNAMSRSGVSFTDQQKDLVKELVATNRLFEAQSLILDVVEAQVKGQATAAFNAGGSLEKLQVIVGNLGKSLGSTLLPPLEAVATALGDVATQGKESSDVFRVIGTVVNGLTQIVLNGVHALVLIWGQIIGVGKIAVKVFSGDISGAIDTAGELWDQGIKDVKAYGGAWGDTFDRIGDIWKSTTDKIDPNATFNFDTGKITPLVPAFEEVDETVGKTATTLNSLNEELKSLQKARGGIDILDTEALEKNEQSIKNINAQIDALKVKTATPVKIIESPEEGPSKEEFQKAVYDAQVAADEELVALEQKKLDDIEALQKASQDAFITNFAATNDVAFNLAKKKIEDEFLLMLNGQEATLEQTAVFNEQMAELDKARLDASLENAQALADALGSAASAFPAHTAAYKILASTEAAIAGALAIVKALALGPILGPIAAVGIGAAVAGQLAKINAAHGGGTFQGGRKVPGFARGGDFMVPSGFPNDSFPLRVESGERVTVTPRNQIAAGAGEIGKLGNKIDATNRNLAMVLSAITKQKLDVNIDGKSFVKRGTQPATNRLRKAGVDLSLL